MKTLFSLLISLYLLGAFIEQCIDADFHGIMLGISLFATTVYSWYLKDERAAAMREVKRLGGVIRGHIDEME